MLLNECKENNETDKEKYLHYILDSSKNNFHIVNEPKIDSKDKYEEILDTYKKNFEEQITGTIFEKNKEDIWDEILIVLCGDYFDLSEYTNKADANKKNLELLRELRFADTKNEKGTGKQIKGLHKHNLEQATIDCFANALEEEILKSYPFRYETREEVMQKFDYQNNEKEILKDYIDFERFYYNCRETVLVKEISSEKIITLMIDYINREHAQCDVENEYMSSKKNRHIHALYLIFDKYKDTKMTNNLYYRIAKICKSLNLIDTYNIKTWKEIDDIEVKMRQWSKSVYKESTKYHLHLDKK